jgi:chromosome segregation ATPase
MAEWHHAAVEKIILINEKIAYQKKKIVDLTKSLAEEQAKRAEVERNLEASNQQIQQLQEEKKTLAKNLDESREKIKAQDEEIAKVNSDVDEFLVELEAQEK